jgi:rubrerythrin
MSTIAEQEEKRKQEQLQGTFYLSTCQIDMARDELQMLRKLTNKLNAQLNAQKKKYQKIIHNLQEDKFNSALDRYNATKGHQKEIRLHEAVRELFVIAKATKRELFYCSECGHLWLSERDETECFNCHEESPERITKDTKRFDVTRNLIRNQ